MKAVLDLPASLLRKARAVAEKNGTTIEKLTAHGIRLAMADKWMKPARRRKMSKAELDAWLEKERAITEQFRAFLSVDTSPVAEIVSSMRR